MGESSALVAPPPKEEDKQLDLEDKNVQDELISWAGTEKRVAIEGKNWVISKIGHLAEDSNVYK